MTFLYHGLSGHEADTKFNLPANRELRGPRTCNIRAATKEDLRVYFHNTFELYEKVFEPLATDEAYTIQPVHKLRHPMIFYLGHTASFYMNKLVVAGLTTRINAVIEKMFAIGVDEMSWDDLNPGHYNWPTVKEVWEYRQKVRERINSLILEHPFVPPITFKSSAENMNTAFFWIVLMGIEHERIHLETASVHLRELPLRLVNDHPFWSPCPNVASDPPTNELIPVKGTTVLVGRQHDAPVAMYGWDCDYSDNYTISVADFSASKYLVSNKEYSEFMADNGYGRQEFWDEEGWKWVQWKQVKHPWFWEPKEGGKNEFKLRVQTKLIDLPWSWPVEVNHLESSAFVRWKAHKTGKKIRMPTEAEWLRLWDLFVGKDQCEWTTAPGNINLEKYTSSCPVDEFKQGELYDVAGNVWQHCETATYPYPGFQVHPVYDDFSVPTFDGRHLCMKGGAWISTGNEATRDARYAFRRHFFQMIGIRYIEGVDLELSVQRAGRHYAHVLGVDPEVDQRTYLAYDSHRNDICFPRDCAHAALAAFKKYGNGNPKRAMDINCGTGRATFELSTVFAEVFGVERSARPLQCSYALKERGEFSYSVVVDGDRREARTVQRAQFPGIFNSEKVNFVQCDAANLHAYLQDFDLIVAWDVVDRSYNPQAVLEALAKRLVSGGLLVIVSAFRWNAKLTPQAAWLSGTGFDDFRNPLQEVAKILAPVNVQQVVVGPELTLYEPSTIKTGFIGTATFSVWKKE